MIKTLLATASAVTLAIGSASAATVINLNPLPGSNDADAQVFFDPDETQYEFVVSGFSGSIYDATVSASGETEVLERIRVGIGPSGGDFSVADQMLDIVNGDLGFGGAEFEDIGMDFSLYVQILGDNPIQQGFDVNVYADRDGDNIIPVPAAGLFMLTALGGFGVARRRRKGATK